MGDNCQQTWRGQRLRVQSNPLACNYFKYKDREAQSFRVRCDRFQR